MKTVAEFVHSEAVMKKVLELGIDFSQGAHIGMPDKELRSVPRFRKLA